MINALVYSKILQNILAKTKTKERSAECCKNNWNMTSQNELYFCKGKQWHGQKIWGTEVKKHAK